MALPKVESHHIDFAYNPCDPEHIYVTDIQRETSLLNFLRTLGSVFGRSGDTYTASVAINITDHNIAEKELKKAPYSTFWQNRVAATNALLPEKLQDEHKFTS